MEETFEQLKQQLTDRKQEWEAAKNLNHATSVFVCNRRIQKLNEALELVNEVEVIDEYTRR